MKYINHLLIILAVALVSIGSFSSSSTASVFDTSLSSLFDKKDDGFLPVDEAFQFDFSEDGNKLNITFTIEEGYYLYRHQFKFKSKNSEIVNVILPQGEEYEDEYFGKQQVFYQTLSFPITIIEAGNNATLTMTYQGCAKKGLCYPPTQKEIPLSPVDYVSDSNDILNAITPTEDGSTSEQKTSTQPVSEQNELLSLLSGQESLLWVLLVFFGGGLLLSFTPCVFPMYPILAGIIVGQGKGLTNKRAFTLSFVYVQGMAITYTILGVIVALAGAQFQAMFQHPAVLIFLSILFIFLALSMFGVFNLSLPSSWQNKLNEISNSQKGGSVTGVLMMGVISGLVASPCTTAPLTGALLYIAQSGDIVVGASALYALSLGMGIPLLVLGSSGGKILPKAGAWMDVIKNIFGLLLLAVPIFLLERFIPEAVSAWLWVALILASFTYFYVVNQSSNEKKSFAYGLRTLVIFLGLFYGANSAYQLIHPPVHSAANAHQAFEFVDNLEELNQRIAKANANGKSVMVDLYADWCIACKEFEKYTFPDKAVQEALANSVLIQIDLTDTGSEESVELMTKFDVFGLPSILFFDTNGNELTEQRVTGFMGAEEFAAHINKIL